MRRREFIALLGGAAAAWPLAARAQQLDRTRRIGVIMGFAEDDQVWQSYLATFRQRLQDFGWSEGHNIRFDYRFTGESTDRMRAAATEVVAMAPDVIFVSTNPVVSALLQVTRTIPIVFTWVSDSVGSGYVARIRAGILPASIITNRRSVRNGWAFSRRSRLRCAGQHSSTFPRSPRTLRSCVWAKLLPPHLG